MVTRSSTSTLEVVKSGLSGQNTESVTWRTHLEMLSEDTGEKYKKIKR